MSLFCDCREDGFCNRYQREMGGRMRELCAGINVDLGTSAVFREQWLREAGGPRSGESSCGVPLLLKTDQAPGDAVAMTAAIWSLHRAYPGKYVTAVESYWPDVFIHNPDVSMHLVPSTGVLNEVPQVMAEVRMHYPAIHLSNERGIHFMQGWCEFLGTALGVTVLLLTNRPHLYFAGPAPPVEDFWLVCSGGKRDFTNKMWGQYNYQEVVRQLEGKVKFVQVGGSNPPTRWNESCLGSQEDEHLRIDGAWDMIGKTTLRELFDLVRRARGVLCGVSLLMHVAAALEKPAIVIAGGREPVAWNAYPRQHYLHTVGMLPCHDTNGRVGGACWRARVLPLGDGTTLDRDTCEYPTDGTPTKLSRQVVPRCMTMIRPAEVAELILKYNY